MRTIHKKGFVTTFPTLALIILILFLYIFFSFLLGVQKGSNDKIDIAFSNNMDAKNAMLDTLATQYRQIPTTLALSRYNHDNSNGPIKSHLLTTFALFNIQEPCYDFGEFVTIKKKATSISIVSKSDKAFCDFSDPEFTGVQISDRMFYYYSGVPK
ncbi:MAG: hypothetical protein ACI8Y7_000916 [Candidatus Woesearchaeota archaeon]|jgi:hypothetical protein